MIPGSKAVMESLLKDEEECPLTEGMLDEKGEAKPKSDGLGLVGKAESPLLVLLAIVRSVLGGARRVCVASEIVMIGAPGAPLLDDPEVSVGEYRELELQVEVVSR